MIYDLALADTYFFNSSLSEVSFGTGSSLGLGFATVSSEITLSGYSISQKTKFRSNFILVPSELAIFRLSNAYGFIEVLICRLVNRGIF